jgi:hypothetical protein
MNGDGDLSRRFIDFSAEVTAFSAFDLHGTGQAQAYLSTVVSVVGEAVLTELLDAYDRAAAASAGAARAGGARAEGARAEGARAEGARAVGAAAEGTSTTSRARALAAEVFSDEKLGPVARNVIKLWYAGTWYELPKEWTESFGALANDGTFTASPQAYPEALLWRAIGANPPGARAPGYGSWAFPPVFPPIPGEERAPAATRAVPVGPIRTEVPAQRGPEKRPLVTDSAKETAR